MIAYDLPTSLFIGGVEYPIRTDFRAVLDVLIACNDPELDDRYKVATMMEIMVPDIEKVPEEHMEEAAEKVRAFIDCGQSPEPDRKRPQLVDWEQDAPIIVPAVNGVAHTEIRALPYLHWWSFWGYFMEIGESLFSSVVTIRQKKAKGQKLEKHEQEYYRENRKLIDIRKKQSPEEKAEMEYINKWL